MKPTIGFIGAGRVATALAIRLHEMGYRITGVYSRTLESAEKLARLLANAGLQSSDDYPQADILFLTVPDDEIAAVAETLAQQLANAGLQPDENIRAVVHCSGVYDSTILGVLHKDAGSFHPLYPFREGTTLTGSEEMLIAIEASNLWLESALVEMAKAIGGQPVILKTGQKATYHTAAVIASNYLVTLFDVSLQLMTQAGVPQNIAQEALYQLMQGNLNNLRSLAPETALTGPIARGDVATLRKHLVALSGTPYEALYRELGRHTANLTTAHREAIVDLFTSKDS